MVMQIMKTKKARPIFVWRGWWPNAKNTHMQRGVVQFGFLQFIECKINPDHAFLQN